MNKKLVSVIDAILPQTQCRECGYPSCQAYAEAICLQNESIGLCAPGGETTLLKIAALTEKSALLYKDLVVERYRAPATAIIIEDECIGCTKCIAACPVDAIIGTAKHMHTILDDECTGCGLCVEPCPVDCITLLPISEIKYQPTLARDRFNARQQRTITTQTSKNQPLDEANLAQSKQAFIQAALARNAARKS